MKREERGEQREREREREREKGVTCRHKNECDKGKELS